MDKQKQIRKLMQSIQNIESDIDRLWRAVIEIEERLNMRSRNARMVRAIKLARQEWHLHR